MKILIFKDYWSKFVISQKMKKYVFTNNDDTVVNGRYYMKSIYQTRLGVSFKNSRKTSTKIY